MINMDILILNFDSQSKYGYFDSCQLAILILKMMRDHPLRGHILFDKPHFFHRAESLGKLASKVVHGSAIN